jgi:cbb3-type cytochrome oxidase subunit 3
MELDYNAMKFWFDVFLSICLLASILHNWISNKSRVNKKEIEQVNDAVLKLKDRVVQVEGQMKNAPTHTDLSNIYNRINGVSQDISEMSGAMKAMTSQLSLINEHLLNGGKH